MAGGHDPILGFKKIPSNRSPDRMAGKISRGSQPGPDFENAFAITIAIENRSGKIRNRFSFHNRIPIFM